MSKGSPATGASSSTATVRLGTRRSDLAMWQARAAAAAWQAAHPDGPAVTLVPMETRGDRDPRALADVGRGMFAHDLEAALARGEIDAAVHSAKDLPVGEQVVGLVLAAWLPRADPRDALVGGPHSLEQLPPGARVATGSARRASALATMRADIETAPIRGNVATRIATSASRGDDACMLAMAGLERLELTAEHEVHALPVTQVVPEAAQGGVVVQTRAGDAAMWRSVDHVTTRRAVTLERAIAALLGGGCERPVGVHVELAAGRVHAFVAPEAAAPGSVVCLELVELELAPLVSVASPTDIDDAAQWVADQLLPRIEYELEAAAAAGGAA